MRRTLAGVATVAVLLGIGAWGLMRWQQPPQGLQAMPAWPAVVPAKVADIVLRASGPAVTRVHLARNGQGWQVQLGKGWQDADGQAVTDMLGTLATMRPDRIVTRNPAHDAELHVTDGADRITLKGADGSVMLDLLVGKPGPDLVSTYVRLVGKPAVLSIDRALDWQVRRPASAWVKPSPPASGRKAPKP
jgi:hypothetical protein